MISLHSDAGFCFGFISVYGINLFVIRALTRLIFKGH